MVLDPTRQSLLRHYRIVSTLGTALAVGTIAAGGWAAWRAAFPAAPQEPAAPEQQ